MRSTIVILLFVGAVAATVLISQTSAGKDDQLWQHRNRGKAFYENPTTQLQAVEEFRKALELNESARERLNYGLALLRAGKTPEGVAELAKVQKQEAKLPHTWFNLGIHYKKSGETAQALEQFERMAKLVPSDPVTQYNLGVLYKLEGKLPAAMEKFREASRLAPHLAAPHFQLYNAYRLSNRREEAMKELAVFQEMKKAMEASGNSEDMEWNEYAEVYDPIDPATTSSDAVDMKAVKFTARAIAAPMDPVSAGMLVFNYNNDAFADVVAWSSKGGVLISGPGTLAPMPAFQAGLFFAAADINNDALPELCMLTATGAELFRNKAGRLTKAAKPLAAGAFVKALWIDYDHDYDLDLMLFGEKPMLLRNQGEAGFVDRTADFPFAKGTPVDAAAFRTLADTKGVDVYVTYRDRATVFYRDRLAGRFDAEAMPAIPQGARDLAYADLNHDSYFDLVFRHEGKLAVITNDRGNWKQQAGPAIAGPYTFADLDNSGVIGIVPGMAAADFNNDGRADTAAVTTKGVTLSVNATATRNRWFAVRLNGTKNLKLAQGSEVEIKAGRRYQKKIYDGFPLHFGLRGYSVIDAVRITWPNGMIQNETKQAVGRTAVYNEAQRLSGSCPMIFTWNGKRFEFITDVLGVAPLGASAGDGSYFPTDHDEYVSIAGESLREADGHFDFRITEELAEVTYLDRLKLIAVDHPAEVEVYSNDKWKSPPYPEFRLYSTETRQYPVAARDGKGNDVLGRLRKRDRRYADTFRRDFRNAAETHTLELEFASALPDNAFLVLNGWVDWADGSTFRARSQEPGKALIPPYLQALDSKGEWRTVIEDMGIPSGKEKTIAVNLTGIEARRLRIVTSMVVYWDEVFVGVDQGARPRLHEMAVSSAELGFHGFSRPTIHPLRLEPESFDYHSTAAASNWNPTPGFYTRFGDVRELLGEADDMFVIMGSGDELKVRFPAKLPALPKGWKRDFLLLVDGWAKDADANTAFSQSVEPLPFHGMSAYPYGAGERYPGDAAHTAYRRQYNTRPALRPLRPLTD